jgi:hypothetical protein
MCIRIPGALALLLAATAAIAEITVTTDKPVYEVGEVVRISAHNSGPEDVELVSFPHFQIWHEASGACVYGCVGLPVVELFPAGETVTTERNTGAAPDEPGTYIVGIAVLDGPSTTYTLLADVEEERDSWTTLKARYR